MAYSAAALDVTIGPASKAFSVNSPPPCIALRKQCGILDLMKHLSIELLERYALREVSIYEQQRVEAHITRCPECLDRLQGEVAWVNGMRLMNP